MFIFAPAVQGARVRRQRPVSHATIAIASSSISHHQAELRAWPTTSYRATQRYRKAQSPEILTSYRLTPPLREPPLAPCRGGDHRRVEQR